MTAAEQQFPNPPSSPSWLNIAQNVFERQVARWDNATCDGGLRWQIFTFNTGYDYKSAISTGIFFQLAARLARFTGDQRYAEWATRSYDWINSVGLVNSDFDVFDGAQIDQDCTSVNKLQWTYNAATFLYGSAIMYNFVCRTSRLHIRCHADHDRPMATPNGRIGHKVSCLECPSSPPVIPIRLLPTLQRHRALCMRLRANWKAPALLTCTA